MTTYTNNLVSTKLTSRHGLSGFRSMIPSASGHSTSQLNMSDLVAKPAFYQDPDGSPQNYYQMRSNRFNGLYRQGTGASAATWSLQGNDRGAITIFQAYTGRNRGTSTATHSAPTIQKLPDTTSNIKISDYAGVMECGLVHDSCDLQNQNKNGRMTNAASLSALYGWHVMTCAAAGNARAFGSFYGLNTSGSVYSRNSGSNYGANHADIRGQVSGYNAKNSNLTFRESTVGMENIGIQYISMYRVQNTWAEIYLNNITAPGDRIVVCVVSSGGTMYTHTGDPFYVRTEGGSSISGNTISTHVTPRKNETGTDTWAAVYSCVCGGAVGRIGLNPYHSSNTNYTLYGVFVIKGPRTTVDYAIPVKYTGGTAGNNAYVNQVNGTITSDPSNYRTHKWSLVTAMSPFTNNGVMGNTSYNGGILSDVNNGGTIRNGVPNTAYEDFRWKSGTPGGSLISAWSGSWADDTSYRYLVSAGKYGSGWAQGGYTNTGQQFQHLKQDFELFVIAGHRGHTDFN